MISFLGFGPLLHQKKKNFRSWITTFGLSKLIFNLYILLLTPNGSSWKRKRIIKDVCTLDVIPPGWEIKEIEHREVIIWFVIYMIRYKNKNIKDEKGKTSVYTLYYLCVYKSIIIERKILRKYSFILYQIALRQYCWLLGFVLCNASYFSFEINEEKKRGKTKIKSINIMRGKLPKRFRVSHTEIWKI